MKISLKPTTKFGQWSAGLIIAFFLFIAASLILVSSGQGGGDTLILFHPLTIMMGLAGISAVSSLVTGLIGIIKQKERSIAVFLASGIGFYFLFLLLGEILSLAGILPPH